MPQFIKTYILFCVVSLAALSGCQREVGKEIDYDKPKRWMKDYFDKKYLLYKLSGEYYKDQKLNHSFENISSDFISDFKPLGYDADLNLQYTHVYSDACTYHVSDTTLKYAEVCFPNTCLTKDSARAEVTLTNSSSQSKTFFVRLFYQNTTYWQPTDNTIDWGWDGYLDNYYGTSEVQQIRVAPHDKATVQLAYTIGMDPKHSFPSYWSWRDPARAGNYEFMVLALPDKSNALMKDTLDLKKLNPFAELKKDELKNKGQKYNNNFAYASPTHFKFVLLEEFFDGTNALDKNHLYLPLDNYQKKLCDTCTGWYRNVISENWTSEEFFNGYLSKAGFVKAHYGQREDNYSIDSTGITLTSPKSTRGNYQKTWGEFVMMPSFKYGHLTVRAKFSEMLNKQGTPNGQVHNLWLYQRFLEPVDPKDPYPDIVDGSGLKPFEIDFEIWSTSAYDEGTAWNRNAFINYSIVDYMRAPWVSLKPGEEKTYGNYKIERFNKRQANVIGKEMDENFFKYWHTYELYWYHDHVRFLVDGEEKAIITNEAARIPDLPMFLWIGTPIYQDGTYYTQSFVPFLKNDKQSIIDYIRIE